MEEDEDPVKDTAAGKDDRTKREKGGILMFNYGRGTGRRSYARIVSLLAERKMTETELAYALNCRPLNLSRNLEDAEACGYIVSNGEFYELTEAGRSYVGMLRENFGSYSKRMHRNMSGRYLGPRAGNGFRRGGHRQHGGY